MSESVLQKHWYDGWFYSVFIDSDTHAFRDRMLHFIQPGKRIIDIGCGTGGFALKMAQQSDFVLGVDISRMQIDRAMKRLERSGLSNIEFIHINALSIDASKYGTFDYATLSFMLHEIEPVQRLAILERLKGVARQLVILEYHMPHPWNFWGVSTRLVEFFAGSDHFSNFKDFGRRGGLHVLLGDTGYRIVSEKINRYRIFTTVLAETG